MKRTLATLSLILVVCSAITAQIRSGGTTQTSDIRVENDTGFLFYFLIADGTAAELRNLQNNADMVISRLQESEDKLQYVASKSSIGNVTVPERSSLLLGFALEPGTVIYPLFSLSIPSKSQRSGDFWVRLSSAKAVRIEGGDQAQIPALDIHLPAPPIKIDGAFIEWLTVPDGFAFRQRSVPLKIRQTIDGLTQDISVNDSLYWKRGGTDLEHLKIIKSDSDWYIMISSYSLMGPGLSYILRIFETGETANNAYTIEIPITDKGGPVVLWTLGQPQSVKIGDYATGEYYVESRFDLSALPIELKEKIMSGQIYLEVSSSYATLDLNEDFYYGSIEWSRIPGL